MTIHSSGKSKNEAEPALDFDNAAKIKIDLEMDDIPYSPEVAEAIEKAKDAFVARLVEELGPEAGFTRLSAQICDEVYLMHRRRIPHE